MLLCVITLLLCRHHAAVCRYAAAVYRHHAAAVCRHHVVVVCHHHAAVVCRHHAVVCRHDATVVCRHHAAVCRHHAAAVCRQNSSCVAFDFNGMSTQPSTERCFLHLDAANLRNRSYISPSVDQYVREPCQVTASTPAPIGEFSQRRFIDGSLRSCQAQQ